MTVRSPYPVRCAAALVALLAAVPSALAQGGPDAPPNVLVIMSDQHHARALGCYGNGFGGVSGSLTPNLDGLAAEGARFESAFCTTAQCCPSRYSILTGRWPHNHGLRGNRVWEAPTETTIAEVARAAGYVTATIGKHHMSWLTQPAPLKFDHGFDEIVDLRHYHEFVAAHGLEPFDAPGNYWKMPGLPAYIEETGYSHLTNEFHPTGYWADRVIDFLERRAGPAGDGKPFLCFYSMYLPHLPTLPSGPADPNDWAHRFAPFDRLQLPPNVDKLATTQRLAEVQEHYAGLDDAQWREVMGYYYGLIAQIDYNIGRVLQRVDELDLGRNTLVVYLSDHGEMTVEMDTWGKGTGGYDAVTRVPLILRQRGVIPPGQVSGELVSLIDLFPTITELTGMPVSDEVRAGLDGLSLLDLVDGGPVPTDWRRAVFTEFGYADGPRSRTIRTAEAKYCFDEMNGGEEELYELGSDPFEELDAHADPALQATADALRQELEAWWGDEEGHAPRYPVAGSPVDPPVRPVDPFPPTGGIDVPRNVDPRWTPCTAAETQIVQLGTDPSALAPFRTLPAMASSFNPGSLAPNTTYYWRVDQLNAHGLTRGQLWNFTTGTTGNGGPQLAVLVLPTDEAQDVPLTLQLRWLPASDATGQHLWFRERGEPQGAPILLAPDETRWSLGPLEAGVTYEWRVDQTNAQGVTQGDVFTFTTDDSVLPELPAIVSPRHLESNVDLGPVPRVRWAAGTGTTHFDVYFGREDPPPFRGRQRRLSYRTGPLQPATTYYWRVDPVNEHGVRPGWTWRFTTAP